MHHCTMDHHSLSLAGLRHRKESNRKTQWAGVKGRMLTLKAIARELGDPNCPECLQGARHYADFSEKVGGIFARYDGAWHKMSESNRGSSVEWTSSFSRQQWHLNLRSRAAVLN